jgi:hypothetical protein
MLNSNGFVNAFTFGDKEQETAHFSQYAAHFWHARMHALVNSSFIFERLNFYTYSASR